ncbi:hypothetical protein F5884DRAFT_774772 [Xylogone sp. PMI_703]|nr:hypothetical protein F5884DRAFT_774772 [Xylogone sp. PMI_703]
MQGEKIVYRAWIYVDGHFLIHSYSQPSLSLCTIEHHSNSFFFSCLRSHCAPIPAIMSAASSMILSAPHTRSHQVAKQQTYIGLCIICFSVLIFHALSTYRSTSNLELPKTIKHADVGVLLRRIDDLSDNFDRLKKEIRSIIAQEMVTIISPQLPFIDQKRIPKKTQELDQRRVTFALIGTWGGFFGLYGTYLYFEGLKAISREIMLKMVFLSCLAANAGLAAAILAPGIKEWDTYIFYTLWPACGSLVLGTLFLMPSTPSLLSSSPPSPRMENQSFEEKKQLF